MLHRFSLKRKVEKKMFQVKLETRQLIWMRHLGARPEGVGEIPIYISLKISPISG